MPSHFARLKKVVKLREFPVAVGITIVVVLILTAVIASQTNTRLLDLARQTAREDAAQNADAIAGALQRELTNVDVIARAIRYSIEQNPNLTQQEYQNLVEPLIGTTPAILVVGRSRGFVIEQIYPISGNEKAIGLDYRLVPTQFMAVREALNSGKASLEGPVDLVQGGKAFIQRTPYYPNNRQDMSRIASGLISVVVDRERLMAQIYQDLGIEAHEIAIRSLTPDSMPAKMKYGPESIFDNNPILRRVPTDSSTWQIGLVPSSGWPAHVRAEGYVWVLSFLSSALLCGMILALWSMYRSKRIAEGQLRSAINSIDDGFALYDELDRLVFANEKYLSYYDLSRSAIYPGNTFENILREGLKNGQYKDAIGREDEWLQERLDKHFNPTEPIEQKLGDGRWLKVAETRSPDGNTVGFRVDITELKQARERAEAANRAKNNFLNIISHELRTPLTSVIGYARFLENLEVLPGFKALDHAVRSGADKSECAEALAALRNDVSGMSGRITTASDHLLGLINDVLDRAKLEAETVELNLERIDLKDTVKTVTSGLGIKATEKGISLTSDVAPLAVAADAKRLRQVLINVVGNAIKFTETGGVHLSSDSDDTQVRITVRDTGCGIPADQLDQIFDQFVQVDTSVTRRNSGTGLGLAISRELIELHGGEISVESEEGRGSTFTITLPIRARTPTELAA
ncbi:Non-motile and phage-resistance protein [Roseovarius sp. THAF9]|uniref:sensor histidine kinase n=1 Tax=Roseovarius sp. THAF9 TaxID=2587847 RepID=UPI0012681AFF|nr:ATP-binding protein [Roseovarius sp. THAF9]QFT92352.1 Non-motile and phage-resistance protein [Roseovarius sp. THAF9]